MCLSLSVISVKMLKNQWKYLKSSKLLKIFENAQNLRKCSKSLKMLKIFENAQNLRKCSKSSKMLQILKMLDTKMLSEGFKVSGHVIFT